MDKVLFSTGKDDWETPQNLFDHFNRLFNFQLDVCANSQNTKCDKYYTIENDGLKQVWMNCNWCNPPYSKGNQWKFIKKAYEESLKGNLTVCLIPVRTDTKTWQNYVMKADYIQYIKGRLKFSNSKNSAPFPSAIVIFGLKYIKEN